ncbi:Arm DNA-binding domain-containing protein [uncultured Acinetobacter sp.]|uniref:Arm DNA-binding domain-containing protein n=1 Tax=uncultured Acinetobacter sp. TaxID=165433 RepID=UPI0025881932|nr:Arm DNA-binding domain-containing protein [uncultured Acinetobacter sp.]
MDYKSPVTSKINKFPLGVYPTITLEAARKRRDEVRQQITNNIDPAEMLVEQVKVKNSFQHIAS